MPFLPFSLCCSLSWSRSISSSKFGLVRTMCEFLGENGSFEIGEANGSCWSFWAFTNGSFWTFGVVANGSFFWTADKDDSAKGSFPSLLTIKTFPNGSLAAVLAIENGSLLDWGTFANGSLLELLCGDFANGSEILLFWLGLLANGSASNLTLDCFGSIEGVAGSSSESLLFLATFSFFSETNFGNCDVNIEDDCFISAALGLIVNGSLDASFALANGSFWASALTLENGSFPVSALMFANGSLDASFAFANGSLESSKLCLESEFIFRWFKATAKGSSVISELRVFDALAKMSFSSDSFWGWGVFSSSFCLFALFCTIVTCFLRASLKGSSVLMVAFSNGLFSESLFSLFFSFCAKTAEANGSFVSSVEIFFLFRIDCKNGSSSLSSFSSSFLSDFEKESRLNRILWADFLAIKSNGSSPPSDCLRFLTVALANGSSFSSLVSIFCSNSFLVITSALANGSLLGLSWVNVAFANGSLLLLVADLNRSSSGFLVLAFENGSFSSLFEIVLFLLFNKMAFANGSSSSFTSFCFFNLFAFRIEAANGSSSFSSLFSSFPGWLLLGALMTFANGSLSSIGLVLLLAALRTAAENGSSSSLFSSCFCWLLFIMIGLVNGSSLFDWVLVNDLNGSSSSLGWAIGLGLATIFENGSSSGSWFCFLFWLLLIMLANGSSSSSLVVKLFPVLVLFCLFNGITFANGSSSSPFSFCLLLVLALWATFANGSSSFSSLLFFSCCCLFLLDILRAFENGSSLERSKELLLFWALRTAAENGSSSSLFSSCFCWLLFIMIGLVNGSSLFDWVLVNDLNGSSSSLGWAIGLGLATIFENGSSSGSWFCFLFWLLLIMLANGSSSSSFVAVWFSVFELFLFDGIIFANGSLSSTLFSLLVFLIEFANGSSSFSSLLFSSCCGLFLLDKLKVFENGSSLARSIELGLLWALRTAAENGSSSLSLFSSFPCWLLFILIGLENGSLLVLLLVNDLNGSSSSSLGWVVIGLVLRVIFENGSSSGSWFDFRLLIMLANGSSFSSCVVTLSPALELFCLFDGITFANGSSSSLISFGWFVLFDLEAKSENGSSSFSSLLLSFFCGLFLLDKLRLFENGSSLARSIEFGLFWALRTAAENGSSSSSLFPSFSCWILLILIEFENGSCSSLGWVGLELRTIFENGSSSGSWFDFCFWFWLFIMLAKGSSSSSCAVMFPELELFWLFDGIEFANGSYSSKSFAFSSFFDWFILDKLSAFENGSLLVISNELNFFFVASRVIDENGSSSSSSSFSCWLLLGLIEFENGLSLARSNELNFFFVASRVTDENGSARSSLLFSSFPCWLLLISAKFENGSSSGSWFDFCFWFWLLIMLAKGSSSSSCVVIFPELELFWLFDGIEFANGSYSSKSFAFSSFFDWFILDKLSAFENGSLLVISNELNFFFVASRVIDENGSSSSSSSFSCWLLLGLIEFENESPLARSNELALFLLASLTTAENGSSSSSFLFSIFACCCNLVLLKALIWLVNGSSSSIGWAFIWLIWVTLENGSSSSAWFDCLFWLL